MTFESLETRHLLAANLHPDFAWADDGRLRLDYRAEFVGVAPQGIITSSTELDPTVNRYLINWKRHGFDGQLDASFNVRTNNLFEYGFVDPQGRLLLLSTEREPNVLARISRYTTAGVLDTTFGANGTVTFALPATGPAGVNAIIPSNMAVADDGSLFFSLNVIALQRQSGRTIERTSTHIAKVLPGDGLDTSFGTQGFVTADIRTDRSPDSQTGVAIDEAGRVVVASSQKNLTVIRRFSKAGTLDTRFGTRGVIYRNSTLPSRGLHVDALNRVYIADMTGDYVASTAYVTRYTAGGKPDATFGTRGTIRLPDTGNVSSNTSGFLVGNNGELFVNANLHILQLNNDGSFDPDYDGDVSFSTPPSDASETPFNSITLAAHLPDGDFLSAQVDRGGRDVIRLTETPAVSQGTSGRLYVYGTDARDTITIRNAGGGGYVVDRNGTTSAVFSDVTNVYIEGLSGSDRISAAFTSQPIPLDVFAGAGNDIVTTGDADDSVDGGLGDDTLRTAGGVDRVRLGVGNNVLDDTAGGAQVFNERPRGSIGLDIVNQVTGNGGVWSFGIEAGKFIANVTADRFYGTDRGSAGLDLTLHLSEWSRINGSSMDDVIRITGRSRDTILPGLGNDAVFSGEGNDLIAGDGEELGVGKRSVRWNDYYDVGDDQDKVIEGFGDNTVVGGDGDDTLLTGDGRDSVLGGIGRDQIRSGGGSDTITGGGSPNVIFGMGGNDLISGGNNSDTLVGGDGNDRLLGNGGDDLLIAGNPERIRFERAINRLDGGAGSDRVWLESEKDILTSIEVVV